MERTIGFIGAGNMVSAILDGVLRSGMVPAERIWLSNRSREKLLPWREKGLHTTQDNREVARSADVVVLGIKPQMFDEVLPELADLMDGKCVISIAAGISSEYLRRSLPGAEVIRVMPNTPMKLGVGAIAIAEAADVERESFEFACDLFRVTGEIAVIPETQMDDFVAINGSSPAFFFRFAAVMAEEAERAGIDGALALRMAAQSMLGSAEMLLKSDLSAQELEKMVCSPGGTTLAALSAFDDYHFAEMYHEAAVRCAKRSKELGK